MTCYGKTFNCSSKKESLQCVQTKGCNWNSFERICSGNAVQCNELFFYEECLYEENCVWHDTSAKFLAFLFFCFCAIFILYLSKEKNEPIQETQYNIDANNPADDNLHHNILEIK